MSAICQKSTCLALARGLVNRKVGYIKELRGWFIDPDREPDAINYCPYCGTHLMEIHSSPPIQRIAARLVTQPVAPLAQQEAVISCTEKPARAQEQDTGWMPPAPEWDKC